MKKAYIVLAHHRPEQLGRLIGSLDDGQSEFFIHLDRASDRRIFHRELRERECWQFVKSENVQGTLNGLREVVASGREFDVINLISGQDYPLRSNAYINRFFEINRGKIFIEYFPLPAEFLYHRGLDRIHQYHFGDRKRRSRRKLSQWITRMANASILFRRRFPNGLSPFSGWQWWSIPMEAVTEILQFVEQRPDYVRYHRRSLLPDEMFFQTILLNSGSDSLRRNLVNNCLRFIDWDNPNPICPTKLSQKYFGALIESKSLFARKFDVDFDPLILDQLDAFRAEEEKRLSAPDAAQGAGLDFSRGLDYPRSAASRDTKKDLFAQLHPLS